MGGPADAIIAAAKALAAGKRTKGKVKNSSNNQASPFFRVVRGNIVKRAQAGAFDVIVHGANCMCTMGKGVALEIKETFPLASRADMSTPKGERSKMGTISIAEIELDLKTPFAYAETRLAYLTVINAYTQFGWRPEERGNIAERYCAIRQAFRLIKQQYGGKGRQFAFPKIGAGLAGGVWKEIAPIIAEEMKGENCTLVVYDADEVEQEVYEERPMVVVETATSDRSRCRVTGHKIAKGALRVGVEAFKGARFVRMWALPDPFLHAIRFSNAKSDRGKCKLTAKPFKRGRGKCCIPCTKGQTNVTLDSISRVFAPVRASMPDGWAWPPLCDYEGFRAMPAEDQVLVQQQFDSIKTREQATMIAVTMGPVKAKPKVKKVKAAAPEPPHAPVKKAPKRGPQIGWPVIWMDYAAALKRGSAKWAHRFSNDLYDLIVQATLDHDVSVGQGEAVILDISPPQALQGARAFRGLLSENAKRATDDVDWKWSSSCERARRFLAAHFDEELKESTDGVLLGPKAAFKAGWRWFPSPAPSSKSHSHRWYPPGEHVDAISKLGVSVQKDSRGWYLGTGNLCAYIKKQLESAGKQLPGKVKRASKKKRETKGQGSKTSSAERKRKDKTPPINEIVVIGDADDDFEDGAFDDVVVIVENPKRKSRAKRKKESKAVASSSSKTRRRRSKHFA